MLKRPSFLLIIVLVSLVFFALIAVDFSPYLRGPGPYPPDWRWPYEFANTLSRVWFPIGVIALILLVFIRNLNNNKTLFLFVLLGFLLQISLLYYSRSGIEVIVHRTINPMISGYFSVSLQIADLASFIRNFNQNLYDYPMYARFHPPGGILFYYFLEFILRPFSHFFVNILSMSPSHLDVALLWNPLTNFQKFNALVSGFVVAFIANLSIIPIYLSSRILYGEKVALRSAVLFIFIPSVVMFTPLIDVFMPLFTSLSLYLFLKGANQKNNLMLILSGLVLFVGVFFTLSFIPFLFFFLLASFLKFFQEGKGLGRIARVLFLFGLGFITTPFILFFAGLNMIEMIQKIMFYHEAAQAGREHLVWYLYNIYDFILFAGIPIGIIFIFMIINLIRGLRKNRSLKKVDCLFLSFVIMLFVVNFSGAVRAETARIWLPFIPILIIVIANFVTFKLKFTNRQFSLLLLLQAIQVLIFQSVLVAVW